MSIRNALRRKHQPDEQRIEQLVRSLRGVGAKTPGLHESARVEAAYFVAHAKRMHNAELRRQVLIVSSGVMEAGGRTVVGRLKRSRMFWPVTGANAIIALRSAQFPHRSDDRWENRAAA